MFNLISLYLFLSSIIVGFGFKLFLDFILSKFKINKNFIYPIILSPLLMINVIYVIPTSLTYNNNPFNTMLFAISAIFFYIYIKGIEDKKQDNTDHLNEFNISDLLLTILGSGIYILYVISLFSFDLSFFKNISLGLMFQITFLNGFLISLYFIFSKNKLKYNLLGLLIIFILGGIELYIFTQTRITTYFLPNISYILQGLLGFLSMFYILYILYSNKYINHVFIGSFLVFVILGKIIL